MQTIPRRCLLCIFALWATISILMPGAAAAMSSMGALEVTACIDAVPQEGLTCYIWKVAEPDGRSWTSPFDRYKYQLNISSDEQISILAASLAAVTVKDRLPPDRAGKFDAEGVILFEELPPGIYLISADNTSIDGRECLIKPSIVLWNGAAEIYKVELKGEFLPNRAVVRKVIKVWDDNHAVDRPESVSVLLLMDGAVYSHITLSDDNQWRYTWTNLPEGHSYIIMEDAVPDSYTAASEQSGITTVITNTKTKTENPPPPKDPPPLPQTGTSWWLVHLLAGSGIALIVAGTLITKYADSHENYDQNE